MAGEISLTIRLEYNSGGSSFVASIDDVALDVAGSQVWHHRQTITGTAASPETLDTGELGWGGMFYAVNRSADEAISIANLEELVGNGGATPHARLAPGEVCVFPSSPDLAAGLAAYTDDGTAADLEFWLIEE